MGDILKFLKWKILVVLVACTMLIVLAVPASANLMGEKTSSPVRQQLGVAPSLGAADAFAVLAGSAVNNTGSSVIYGDLGLSPGSTLTGSPTVNGTTHLNDTAAQNAQIAVTAAYDNLAGQAYDTDLTASGELGGRTLIPGVYHFNTSAGLTGKLTLDAQNNPNAVFIFQMGSTLTTAVGSSVVVINGANASNVFWQVGSSATLGTTTVFLGNILALTSITLTTGANVKGRLLARNGVVTLDTNNVTYAPTVASISPFSGPAAGGTAVTITGTNFINGATVTIGGAPATNVAWVSATSITATTPAGTVGAKNVVVTNPDTQIGTLTNGYTYVAPIFTLTAPSPFALGNSGVFGIGVNTGFSATAGSVVTNVAGWTLAVSDTKTNTKGYMTLGGDDVITHKLHTPMQVGMTSDTLTTIPLYQGQLRGASGYSATGTFSIPLYASQTVIGTDASGTYRITLTYTATPGP